VIGILASLIAGFQCVCKISFKNIPRFVFVMPELGAADVQILHIATFEWRRSNIEN